MLKFIQNNREITALLAVVLLFVLPGFLDRQYLSVQTLTMVYSSAQILILLAMGATLVMLTRNIDVSVGSITGMCAVLLGMLLNAGYSLPVACVATLLLGLLAGFFNGALVAWLKIPAIVATLGTLGLYRGIMLLWTGGKWIEGLPAELKQLSAPLLLGISAIGWLTIILVAFMAWLLAKTAFGRSFYATGDNLQGARQLGVRTEAIRIVAFSLNGCMAALAGIVFASQIGFIPNQTGTGLEMKAIAACVLGGISLFAGSALLLSGMAGATGYEGIGGFPMAFTDFANLDVLGLPVPLIIFLICLLVFWFWLHKTHAGRNVFLIGQSPRVALYSAIPVNRTLCALYAMTGLASAVAAVLLVSYFGSARSDLGASFLMPAITAVVLGGANIYGGSGSIIGTAIAVLLVGYLQQGLQMAGVPNQVSSALSGALLIVVVVGRSVSLHRQQIKEWLARRANNPLP
ncbi:autoinducer 2 ABC transporter permease LsrC [Shigella flexneri]|nr:autoinducer 2 ABC transporter permease LsrC [Shigella flexneri]